MTLQNSVHLYWCSCNQKGLEYSQVLYLAPGSEHVQLWLRFKDSKSFLLGFSKILTAGVSEMISKGHLLQDSHRFVGRIKGKLAGFLIVLLQLQSNCFHYSVSLSTKALYEDWSQEVHIYQGHLQRLFSGTTMILWELDEFDKLLCSVFSILVLSKSRSTGNMF